MAYSRDALEGLLDLCDQIREARDASLHQGAERPVRVPGAQLRELREQACRAPRASGAGPKLRALRDPEFLILALLFHRRLLGVNEPATGGELVALLSQAGFARSDVLLLLGARAPLRRDGWLTARTEGRGFDPLDSRFALPADSAALFWPEEEAAPAAPAAAEPPAPYGSEEECLWDLFGWRNLCIQRAEGLLEGDCAALPPPRLRVLRRDARAALLRIRARLAATAGSGSFALERFRRQRRLGTDEWLVVVHLIFCELVEGEPFVPALECLRLVAECRTDLFRKRPLFAARGRLRHEGIVVARDDGGDLGKALATELGLADWAADELLSGSARPPRLDERELDDFLRGDGGDE